MSKRRKGGDPEYLIWVRSLPCLVCNERPVEAHHVYNTQVKGGGAFGRKPDDRRTVPLSWKYHSRDSRSSVHSIGKGFWKSHGIDVEKEIERLNQEYDAGPSSRI